ncbi:hypothetical protein EJ07DRAFT_10620, partial [Lizonia empirigonia]
NCPRQVGNFPTRSYYDVDALEEACTADCAASLAKYNTATAGACGTQDVYNVSSSHVAPVSFVPTLLHYYYNKTCIQDGDRWCNRVALEMSDANATILQIVINFDMHADSMASTGRQEQTSLDMCDNCIIKAYQFQAGSPINGGNALREKYSSLTASCSKTGFPLASSTTPFPGASPTSTSPTECSGKIYSIKAGDTCRSISEAQGMGTSWLLANNNLAPFCAKFPKSGDLCISNTCKTYVVQANDTCLDIAKSNRLSQVQLYTWNPVLGYLCNKIEKSVGDSICVSPPGDADFKPNPTTTMVTTPIPTATPTMAPVPGDLANGTNSRCAKFYQVQPDEYCNLLILKFSISLVDFRFLNQGINDNCTNLFANPSLDVNSTSCAPSKDFRYCMAAYNAASVTKPSLPEETGLSYPIREGAIEGCVEYNAAIAPMTCKSFLALNRITIAQLFKWNPAVGADCSNLWLGYQYCVSTDAVPTDIASSTDTPTTTPTPTPTKTTSATPSPTAPSAPGPTHPGTVENYSDTCWSITQEHGITLDQFYKW